MSSAIHHASIPITSTNILIDMTGSTSTNLRPPLIGHFPVVKSGSSVTSRPSVHNRRIDFNHAYQTNYLFLVFIPRIVQVGPIHQRCTILPAGDRRKVVETERRKAEEESSNEWKSGRVGGGELWEGKREGRVKKRRRERNTYPTTKRFQTRTNPLTTY